MISYLLNRGANVNAKDHHGATALHHAATSRNIKLIIYLVEQGAEVDSEDRWGKTPLDLAKRNNIFGGNSDIVTYLNSVIQNKNSE